MIEITIPANFLPERQYVLDVFCSTLLNLKYHLKEKENVQSYVFRNGDRTLEIQDHFFSQFENPQDYLKQEHLPEAIVEAKSPGLEKAVILYGQDKLEANEKSVLCEVDFFGSTFLMLTRWEEMVRSDRDEHDRFPLESSLAYKHNFYQRAIVDEYAALLKKLLKQIGVNADTSRTFSKKITCDADHPSYWAGGSPVKKILGPLFKQASISKSMKSLSSYKRFRKGIEKDPFDTFSEMMDAAEAGNHQMLFFFPTGGSNKFDCNFDLNSTPMQILFNSIKERGHEIGLHPGYESPTDPSLMKREKEVLENAMNLSINSSRQHYLRCHLPETWRHLDKVGIRHDYTIGYSESPGFRCGTCTPYPVFDVETRTTLALYEHPLNVMDVSLRWYQKLSPDQAVKQVQRIINEVRRHRGEFVLLWHNSSFNLNGWDNYSEVFHTALKE